jgi:netrin-G3 ligand
MPFVKWRQGVKDLTPDDAVPIGKNVLLLSNIRKTNTYTCVAASKLGIIETKTSVKVQSLPQAPTNVRVQDVQPTSVRLSWSYDGDVVSDVQYYVIQYKPKAATWDYKEISGAITNFYDIRGLSPYTEYEFGVLAVNNVGRGKKSIAALATTGETKPGGTGTMGDDRPGSSPRNVIVRPLSSSTMVIQWDEPEEQNGVVTGYKVYYTTTPNKPLSQWDSQFVDNNKLTTISDLTPHTIYTIRVEAYTSIGPGPCPTQFR